MQAFISALAIISAPTLVYTSTVLPAHSSTLKSFHAFTSTLAHALSHFYPTLTLSFALYLTLALFYGPSFVPAHVSNLHLTPASTPFFTSVSKPYFRSRCYLGSPPRLYFALAQAPTPALIHVPNLLLFTLLLLILLAHLQPSLLTPLPLLLFTTPFLPLLLILFLLFFAMYFFASVSIFFYYHCRCHSLRKVNKAHLLHIFFRYLEKLTISLLWLLYTNDLTVQWILSLFVAVRNEKIIFGLIQLYLCNFGDRWDNK